MNKERVSMLIGNRSLATGLQNLQGEWIGDWRV